VINFDDIAGHAEGLFGAAEGLTGLVPEQLQGVLQSAGMEPTALLDMPFDQVTQLLADNGIDVANLDQAQVMEIVQQLAGGEQCGITESVTGWLGSLFSRG
jgi:hypothetical protein